MRQRGNEQRSSSISVATVDAVVYAILNDVDTAFSPREDTAEGVTISTLLDTGKERLQEYFPKLMRELEESGRPPTFPQRVAINQREIG